jgi:hypothetical protein
MDIYTHTMLTQRYDHSYLKNLNGDTFLHITNNPVRSASTTSVGLHLYPFPPCCLSSLCPVYKNFYKQLKSFMVMLASYLWLTCISSIPNLYSWGLWTISLEGHHDHLSRWQERYGLKTWSQLWRFMFFGLFEKTKKSYCSSSLICRSPSKAIWCY